MSACRRVGRVFETHRERLAPRWPSKTRPTLRAGPFPVIRPCRSCKRHERVNPVIVSETVVSYQSAADEWGRRREKILTGGAELSPGGRVESSISDRHGAGHRADE